MKIITASFLFCWNKIRTKPSSAFIILFQKTQNEKETFSNAFRHGNTHTHTHGHSCWVCERVNPNKPHEVIIKQVFTLFLLLLCCAKLPVKLSWANEFFASQSFCILIFWWSKIALKLWKIKVNKTTFNYISKYIDYSLFYVSVFVEIAFVYCRIFNILKILCVFYAALKSRQHNLFVSLVC